jgi:hypothetical protein
MIILILIGNAPPSLLHTYGGASLPQDLDKVRSQSCEFSFHPGHVPVTVPCIALLQDLDKVRSAITRFQEGGQGGPIGVARAMVNS